MSFKDLKFGRDNYTLKNWFISKVLQLIFLLPQRAQTEAVTFLGNQDNGRTLYAVPGLDYIGHEDVMPYTAGNKRPIRHDLFDKFLVHSSDKGIFTAGH